MTVPAITDPQRIPSYRNTAFQRAIESMLVDPRDAVFVRVVLKNLAIMVPLDVALFVLPFRWWYAVPFYLVQLAWLLPTTILMLHNTMHRPFFASPKALNRVVPFLMSLLFGIPTAYTEHHVGMHHAENNLRADLSSTMKYQRDNLFHWLIYFGRFLFFSHVEIVLYFQKKGRPAMWQRALFGEFLHVAVMVAFGFVNLPATLVTMVIPFFTVRFLMMWGNWGQHAFIDASRPGDSFVNSITCINSPYNHKAFNDGYHIGHHVKQTRHWTDMPQDFLDNVDRYAKEGCVVFEGVDFFMVSLFLFLHRYDWLARRFVRLPGDERTDEQVIAFLKERTRRIADEVPEGVVLNA